MTLNNTTMIVNDFVETKSTGDVLNQISANFLVYLPLIFLIFGLLGFIGNVFTYLQAELRSNTCCIYSLCGSFIDIITLLLNQFPNYLAAKYGIYIPWYTSSTLCKTNLFLLVFLPHLSINFLLMAIIDRYAATCSFTSPIQRLNQLKMVPLMIGMTMIISCLASIYAPILFDLQFGFWCASTQPTKTSILYVILIGLSQPIVMLIFVLLTYRNVRRSRRRVGGLNRTNPRQHRTQFVVMIFAQIFVTAFFSLQWIILYICYTISTNTVLSMDEWAIIMFAFSLTNNCYYLNNVKSFYISMLTCRLFRKTFIKGSIELFPRYLRPRFQVTQTNLSIATTTMRRRGDITRY